MTIEFETRRFGIKTKTEVIKPYTDKAKFQYIDYSDPLIPSKITVVIPTDDSVVIFSEPALNIREASVELGMPQSPLSESDVQSMLKEHKVLRRDKINKAKIKIPTRRFGEIKTIKWSSKI